MKKKLFSLTLSVIAAFSAFNSIYETAANADDDFTAGLAEWESTSKEMILDELLAISEDEHAEFIKEYGNISVHGKYIVYCGEVNYSTGAKLMVKQYGTAEIKEYRQYSVSDGIVGAGGGAAKIVSIYEAVTAGTLRLSFAAGRSWENIPDEKKIIRNYIISEDFTITETEEIADVIKGDVNGDFEFNITDAVVLQKWLLAVPDVELVNWKAGDLCEDDKLDVFDLCLMKRALSEKLNDIPQNANTSFKLHGVADIRTNGDNHTKWTGYIARSKSDLLDIIQENEGVTADEISLEDIDDNAFNDKSLVIIYGICTAGNSYSIIDDISIKGTDIDVSTVSKKPEIATPDMLYRRYIYIIDKNLATNVNGFIFNDTSSYYQFEEEADIVHWFKDWCRS